MPHADVVRCDLFEAAIPRSRLVPREGGDGWWLAMRAFEIATVRIRRRMPR
jgi:hypothetical protein